MIYAFLVGLIVGIVLHAYLGETKNDALIERVDYLQELLDICNDRED